MKDILRLNVTLTKITTNFKFPKKKKKRLVYLIVGHYKFSWKLHEPTDDADFSVLLSFQSFNHSCKCGFRKISKLVLFYMLVC